jgi:hypothetical protein
LWTFSSVAGGRLCVWVLSAFLWSLRSFRPLRLSHTLFPWSGARCARSMAWNGNEGGVTHETLEFLRSAHGSSGEEVVGVLNIAVGGGRHSVGQRAPGRAALEPTDVERDIVCYLALRASVRGAPSALFFLIARWVARWIRGQGRAGHQVGRKARWSGRQGRAGHGERTPAVRAS